jgi:hypothetical protein
MTKYIGFILVILAIFALSCEACASDADCSHIEVCMNGSIHIQDSALNGSLIDLGLCESASLFSSTSTPFDVGLAVVGFLACFIAAGTGLGGGGMLVPLFTLLVNSPRIAVPLAKVTVLGSSIGNCILLFQRKHPFASGRPIIDYDSAALLEPAAMAGTMVGVLLNRILPTWVITGFLFGLLVFIGARTLRQGVLLWRSEAAAAAAAKASSEPRSDELPMLSHDDGADGNQEGDVPTEKDQAEHDDGPSVDKSLAIEETDAKKPDETAEDIVTKPSRWAVLRVTLPQPRHLIVLTTACAMILLAALVRGGHGSPSIFGAPCGGLLFWAAGAAAIVTIMGIVALFARWLLARAATLDASTFCVRGSDQIRVCVDPFGSVGMCTGLCGE